MAKYRYFIFALIIAADQILKFIIRATMNVFDSINVVGDIFSITYIQNRGAAFSLFSGEKTFLIAVPIIAIIAAIWYIETHKSAHWTLSVSLCMIIAGGVSNLADRIILEFVTDMFDFHFWPVFNVADIAICVGCAILVIYVLKFDKSVEK